MQSLTSLYIVVKSLYDAYGKVKQLKHLAEKF